MEKNLDFTQRFVNWFLDNTRVVALLLLAVIFGGLFSLTTLRREGFPSADINVAVIATVYRGASAEEIEKQIVKPIEAAAGETKSVQDINSTSRANVGIVQVTYESGTDFASSLSELRNKVQSVSLPNEADEPSITVPEFGGASSYYVLSSSTLSESDLRKAAISFRTEVEAVDGVKKVAELFEPSYQVNVEWDAAKLAATGIPASQVAQVLQGSNITIPVGEIELSKTTIAPILTSTKLSTTADLKKVIIGADSLGRPVTIADIAEVVEVQESDKVVSTSGIERASGLSSENSLLFEISFKKTADVIATEQELQAALTQVAESSEFSDITITTAVNAADDVREQIDEVISGAIGSPIGDGPFANLGYILGGVWLITLVMLLFVNWRAALVSALAIPLTTLVSLLALKLQGVQLNTLTLFSMVLVLGLVVDPTIVVVEAIQRELDMGKKGREAVLAAVRTIGGGVLMATITNFIVFFPFAVVSGVFGQIIRYIPLTVIPALVASYFIPLIFLTYLSEKLLRRNPKHKAHAEEDLSAAWPIAQRLVRANKWILRRWYIQIPIIALSILIPFGVTFALFSTKKVVGVQFSAPIDTDTLTVSVEYPRNLTRSEKQRYASLPESILQQDDAVAGYYPLTQAESGVTYTVRLVERSEREVSTEIQKRLEERLIALNLPSEKVYYTVKQQGVGAPEQEYPVSVQIYGDNLADLKAAAIATGDLLRDANQFPEVTRVEDGFTGATDKQLVVAVNPEKAARVGLSAFQVSQTLSGLIDRSAAGSFEREVDGELRSTKIYLVGPSDPTEISDVANLVVASSPLGSVKLQDIATVSLEDSFAGISRTNGSRYVTVQAKVVDATKDQAAPQQAIKDFWTPERLDQYNLRPDALENKGSGDDFLKSFQDLFVALGVAVLLTYIVLVVFFKSFSQPLIILFTIPLGFLGVFPAVAAVGGQFGFLEILGLIVLVGIVENVAIFLIDLANTRVKEGATAHDAIADATGLRFRAIFLTSIVTLTGLLPLILFSPFWRSLASVISAGFITSGVLSLFTTPILFCWLIWGKAGIGRVLGRVKRGITKALRKK